MKKAETAIQTAEEHFTFFTEKLVKEAGRDCSDQEVNQILFHALIDRVQDHQKIINIQNYIIGGLAIAVIVCGIRML